MPQLRQAVGPLVHQCGQESQRMFPSTCLQRAYSDLGSRPMPESLQVALSEEFHQESHQIPIDAQISQSAVHPIHCQNVLRIYRSTPVQHGVDNASLLLRHM